MIRKLIPAILIASLAACANTGRQASSTDADSTASSTSSSSADSTGSAGGGGYTGGSGSTDSGGYGGGSGATDSGGYGGGSSSTDSGGAAGDGGYGAAAGGGYGSPFSGGKGCDAQPVQNMIGTKLTSSVEGQIKQASSSSKTRVLKPGEVMTMEYDPQRINLILDQQGALTALRCG